MKTIKVYTAAELETKYPEAYEKAFSDFQDDQNGSYIPWNDEILDSFKAIFEHSNIRLLDYELNTCGYSYVKFSFRGEDETEDLQGNRALAWIENNLLSQFRIPFTGKKRWELAKYGSYYRPGMVKPCPFTGVCFDEDFISALIESVKSGDTLKEAYNHLATVAATIQQAEFEYYSSKEYFMEQDYQFTKDGKRI